MRILVLLVLVLFATRPCVAAPAVTNSISSAVSVTAATNAPATKVPRQQSEAVTKAGYRCKRNAVVGGKLCRQHHKIADEKKKKK